MGPPNSYSNDGADGDGDDDATEGAVEADDDDAEEMVGPTAPLIAPPATVGGGRDGYLSLGFSRIVVVGGGGDMLLYLFFFPRFFAETSYDMYVLCQQR